jgi:hypothetical protein
MFKVFRQDSPLSRCRPLAVLRIAALIVLTAFATAKAHTAETESVPEYNVKAAYLLLFARYAHWPESVFTSADSPLIIAVIGDDPFGGILDETMRDQRVGTHPVQILRVQSPEEASRAHVVFVSGQQRAVERRCWDLFKARPILTVGESTDSLDAGAIVRLVEDRGKIRFDVDWNAAEAAGLKIASPMLVSARRVRGGPSNLRDGARP